MSPVHLSIKNHQQNIFDSVEFLRMIYHFHISKYRGGGAAMSKELKISIGSNSGKSQFLVYEAEAGRIKIDVRLENETVWLNQKLLADDLTPNE